MKPNTENILSCPCGYANDLPISTEKCPKCGLNLEPLSRIYQLSGKYSQLGDESNSKYRPGVAVSYYNSAQHTAINEQTYPLLKAIDIYLGEKNSKFASDLLEYGKEFYPEEMIWEDIEKRILKLKHEEVQIELKQRKIKTGFFVTSGFCMILLVSCALFLLKLKSKEIAKRPLNDYVSYYKKQLAASPEFKNIAVYSDTLIHFTGKLDLNSGNQFLNLMSSTDLPLSKINLKEVSFYSLNKQTFSVDYIVRTGESLSKIAYSMYSDPSKWNIIYVANKDVIKNINQLKSGVHLKIPVENNFKNE